MFDPSLSYLEGFIAIFREEIGVDIFLVMFTAGYFLMDRYWKKKQNSWSTPFFLLYSLLPLAIGLIYASIRSSYHSLKHAFSTHSGHPYNQFADTRYFLILAIIATLLVLLIRLARNRGIQRQEIPDNENKGCRLGTILSIITALSSLALMAGDILFFNFLNLIIPASQAGGAADANINRFIDRARIPQKGMLIANIALLALALLGMVICSMRSSRCRPTQSQEQALRGATLLLIGAILLFFAYCVSQSWTLSRMVIPF